ncbi:MAG TPA: hypothetical protein VGV87_09675, partial [Blastocatellia bacterium]|nr:hypothetical protein [Blastocatellia bacterium]
MVNALLGLILLLALVNIVCLVVLLYRISRTSGGNAEQAVREELRQGREESAQAARDLREEVSQALKSASDTTIRTIGEMALLQRSQLVDALGELKSLTEISQTQLGALRA